MPPHRLHQYAHTKFSYARGSPEDTVAARKCCLANIASQKCTRIQQTRSDPAKSMLGVWRMKECNRANRPELEESTASGAVPAPTQHTFIGRCKLCKSCALFSGAHRPFHAMSKRNPQSQSPEQEDLALETTTVSWLMCYKNCNDGIIRRKGQKRNMTNVLRTFLHPACRNQNMRQLLSTCLLLASLPFFRMRRRPCFHISQQAAGATNLGVSTEKKRCAWLCTLDQQKSRHKSNQRSSNTCKMQLTIS